MTIQPNLTSKLSLSAMREMYHTEAAQSFMRALVIGRKGCGKTRSLMTCVKPVLLDLFDPDGEQTLRDDRGNLPPWLVVRPYYDDDGAKRWIADFERFKRDTEFQRSIGTYVLDSVTQFGDAHVDYSMKTNVAADKRQAYGDFLNRMSYYAKTCANFQCHLLWLGHIARDKDETTGKLIYKTMIAGQSSDKLPTLFSESYVMEAEATGDKKFLCADGTYRWLVVRQNGMYDCSTRIGRMKDDGKTLRFELKEPVDFKALLEKAGLSTEDLPY